MKRMIGIYCIDPAPWGINYRLIEMFDTEEDAEKVLKVLESVNVNFKRYEIVSWSET